MSFYFFKHDADRHLDTAKKLLEIQLDLISNPYYSKKHHYSAAIYPLCHVAKVVVSAARIAQGGLFLLKALVDNPSKNLPQIGQGILQEIGTLIINALNAVASCLLFITRSIATLFNWGYSDDQFKKVTNRLDEAYESHAISGAEGIVMGTIMGAGNNAARFADDAVHTITTNLLM